jgi:uncharacterized transporter YbjL
MLFLLTFLKPGLLLMKNAFSSFFEFFKKHWQPFALGLVVVLVVFCFKFFLNKKSQDTSAQIKQMQDAHDTEIKKILNIRDEERHQHEENIKNLQSQLSSIQVVHDKEEKELDVKKTAEIKKIVRDYGDDPSALAQQLSSVTGFKIIR